MLLQAAADAEQARDGERMAEALLSVQLGIATNFLGDDARTIALLRRALALLPERDSPARARVVASLALEALYTLPYSERRSMADDALAMARRTGDPAAVASVLNAHQWIAMEPQRRHERLALADELVRVGPRASPYAECDGHRFRYLALVEDGDIRAADAALAQARATARLPVSRWGVCQWEAAQAVLSGRLSDAETLMLEGVAAAQDAGFSEPVIQAAAGGMLWSIRHAQGRLQEFSPAMFAMAYAPYRPAWTYAGEAQAAMLHADERAAADAIETAFREGVRDNTPGLYWLSTMMGAAEVCAWLGDRAHGSPVYEILTPCAGVMSPWTGPVGVPLGALAQSLGRPDEAETHMRTAVALCERMHAPAYLAIARLALGRLLLPAAEGRALTEQATADAERIGMPGWAAQGRRALAD